MKLTAWRGVRRMMDNSSEKWLYAKRASARTSPSAHHFHNESQMIKTEFARRAVGSRGNSLPLFYWSFWIAASPLRRWESSHTLLLVIRMSLILVGAFHTFLLGFLWIPNPKWGDEMVTSVWSTARVFEARWFFTGDISRLKHYFYYESHIDKPRWRHLSREGRYILFRWSF